MSSSAIDPGPERDDEAIPRLRRLLTGQRFAVLATRHEGGHPYASLLAYGVDDELQRMVFATLRTTRKFANLQAEPRVALLIDDRDNVETDLQQAAAVTVLGRAEEIVGASRDREVARFLARHPAMADFVGSPGCALMGVVIEAYYLVTRFQNVFEIYPDHGVLRTADRRAR